MDSERILLTGGAGFIGSHLAESLLRRNTELTIVDNLDDFYPIAWKKGNLEYLRRIGKYKFFEIDIRDGTNVRNAVAVSRPDAIIHLAARAGVRPSIEQPCLYQEVNIAGTLNLLEACRELRVQTFVFGSSSSVYGATSRVPFSEEQVEMKPISPYAATKLAGEMLCHTYSHLYQIGVACLRFFTVYGPRQRPDLAIHKFFALLESGRPIPFFGDGSNGRDYTYVADIVAGVIAALDYVRSRGGPSFEVFNLGNSRPVMLSELLAELERVSGRTAILDRRALQPGDVPITWANIEKARQVLGYTPSIPLEAGLEEFAAWYRLADPAQRA